jgi:hypothetical protein
LLSDIFFPLIQPYVTDPHVYRKAKEAGVKIGFLMWGKPSSDTCSIFRSFWLIVGLIVFPSNPHALLKGISKYASAESKKLTAQITICLIY